MIRGDISLVGAAACLASAATAGDGGLVSREEMEDPLVDGGGGGGRRREDLRVPAPMEEGHTSGGLPMISDSAFSLVILVRRKRVPAPMDQ